LEVAILYIIDDFIAKLELKPTISTLLSLHFEKKKKIGEKMISSAFFWQQSNNIPF
jgi:hypothetical protein